MRKEGENVDPGRDRPWQRRFLAHVGLAACLLAHALAAGAADPLPAQQQPAWRVVLIRGWDSLYTANLVRETALRDAILEKAPRLVEFYPEEIDPLRFPAQMEPELADLLRRKYRDTPVDLVIASNIEPLQFLSRHRDEIWPGAKVVFSGVFEGALDGWHRPKGFTGVMLQLDLEGTIGLGRALVPSARKLYVVSGSASFDRHLRDLVLEELAALGSALEIKRIDGLTREDTAATVAGVEPDALVLYLTMLRDASGQLSGPSAPSLTLVTSRSRVPALSVIQTQFRRGPVGGSAPRYDLHGRAAGLLARRVLEGADPDRIVVRAEPQPSCEVDWNGLERWNIPSDNVPPHCRVVNQPPGFTRANAWPIAALLLIVLLQAALIGSLVMQSRRRHKAEAELLARSGEMAQVARLSMVGALTASIAHEINQPIGAILSNAEAAEMMLENKTLDEDKLREILADIRNEDLRASEVIRSLRRLLGQSEWRPVPLELNSEVGEALRHLAFDAARHDTRLSPVFGSEMPAVMGEAVQLQQVVINLVMNAMAAVTSLPGDMREVRIETLARPDGVEVVVADHGPGLSAAEAEQIFHSTFTNKADGMGFGLAIVRTIVEMHRGRVWYEPNLPRGAIFRVWLPAVGA